MENEKLIDDMNIIISKMDKELKSLNSELDKILTKYPRYLENEESRLHYAFHKFSNAK